MSNLELTFTLPDGRKLAFALFGDPSLARTIFYFHGFPGSRLEVGFADRAARERGLSVVGIDRPGFGQSSFSPGRRIIDWPSDINQLADHLGLGAYGVLGISGGAPYALACAHQNANRISGVAVVSGLGSLEVPGTLEQMHFFNRKMLKLARSAPFIANALVRRLTKSLHRHPGALIQWLMTVSPTSDKVILKNPEVRGILKESFREALRGNGDGIAHELGLISSPWGFDPSEIRIPVNLWHGTADDYVPPCMGEHHARTIPLARARFVPDQGHFMVVSLVDEILTELSGG